jgi:hypothetical protein
MIASKTDHGAESEFALKAFTTTAESALNFTIIIATMKLIASCSSCFGQKLNPCDN